MSSKNHAKLDAKGVREFPGDAVNRTQTACDSIGGMRAARNIALVLLLSAATFLFSIPIALGQSTYTIHGQVLDESGGWVPGASVRLYSDQGVRDSRADRDGKFEFANVAKNSYELEVSSAGFKTRSVDFEIAEKAPEPFSIILQVWTGGHCTVTTLEEQSRGEAARSAGVRLSYEKRSGKFDLVGIERDQFGSPLPGVNVKLVKEGASREAVSNEKGEFTFSGLELGKYTLQSTYTGYGDRPSVVWISRENFVRAFVTLVDTSRFCVD